MADSSLPVLHGVVVEETLHFTLVELCRACRAQQEQLIVLVEEGVLQPQGDDPQTWVFAGPSLRRARAALRLSNDLQLNAAGTALVMDLLDEIESLRARLTRIGGR